MFRIFVVFSFTILLYGACNRINTGDVSQSPKPSLPQETIPSDTLIILERTVCFGTCPAYRLTISADGKVVFEGKEFVRVKGIAEDKVSQIQLRQLISEIEKADYFSLKDQYSSEKDGCKASWTDYSSAITTVKLNGKAKTINHYHGCRDETLDRSPGEVYPKQLFDLENKIDETVGTKKWLEPKQE
jgi:hypothetical protein